MLVYCGQTVLWIKVSLDAEVDLGPGDIVLDGDPAPPVESGTAAAPPTFRRKPIVIKRSPISATAELLFCVVSLQRDFEPMTGVMWRDVTRYQLNVAIDKEVTGQIPRPRQLSLAYVGQPLPVYWVETSSTINSAGIEDFYSRVCMLRFHVGRAQYKSSLTSIMYYT